MADQGLPCLRSAATFGWPRVGVAAMADQGLSHLRSAATTRRTGSAEKHAGSQGADTFTGSVAFSHASSSQRTVDDFLFPLTSSSIVVGDSHPMLPNHDVS